jgi:putative ABC transport system substrate-binding protein
MVGTIAEGCLMTCSGNLDAMFRREAYFVERILKGANPGDLAVEQSREFEFVINLKTAQELGLSTPSSLLLQASDLVR